MIGTTLASLLVLAVAQTASIENSSFQGVDPNTLSCDPLGQEFLLLPHFEECNKFYTCVHGREVEMTCASSTIFDFELQTCNWPKATKCWLRTREEDLEGSGEDEGELEWVTPPVDDAVAVVSPAEEVEEKFSAILDCQDASDAARQLPYKGDCQRYWRCIDKLPQSVFCSDGLFFNQKSQQCDFEANVVCEVTHEDELQGEYIVYN